MFINRARGFTLFEVLVYIGLFSLIMAGALFGALQIIDSSTNTRGRIALEQEAHFIFGKIDWALNGEVINVIKPSPGELFVDRSGSTNYTFEISGDSLNLNGDPITSSGIVVNNFYVDIIPAAPPVPKEVEVSFTLNGRQFATSSRYVR